MRSPEPGSIPGCFFSPLRSQSGVTLVLVLVMMMILGLSAGIAGSSWTSLVRRAREADLLWKGSQIRKAIGSYYSSSHGQGAPNIYPSELEFLVKDPRFLETRRHLRRLYVDPMTGEDWVLIKDQGGRIKGVRSSFSGEPFKQAHFSEENKDFEGRTNYTEWEFVFVPKEPKNKPKTAPKGGTPPAGETAPGTPEAPGAGPAAEEGG